MDKIHIKFICNKIKKISVDKKIKLIVSYFYENHTKYQILLILKRNLL